MIDREVDAGDKLAAYVYLNILYKKEGRQSEYFFTVWF
jgi:hypothetical protein